MSLEGLPAGASCSGWSLGAWMTCTGIPRSARARLRGFPLAACPALTAVGCALP